MGCNDPSSFHTTLSSDYGWLFGLSIRLTLKILYSTIKVWDRKTGQLLLDLNSGGHTSRIFKLQFNDTAIVSCSQDSRIIVWDFATRGVDVRFFQ